MLVLFSKAGTFLFVSSRLLLLFEGRLVQEPVHTENRHGDDPRDLGCQHRSGPRAVKGVQRRTAALSRFLTNATKLEPLGSRRHFDIIILLL